MVLFDPWLRRAIADHVDGAKPVFEHGSAHSADIKPKRAADFTSPGALSIALVAEFAAGAAPVSNAVLRCGLAQQQHRNIFTRRSQRLRGPKQLGALLSDSSARQPLACREARALVDAPARNPPLQYSVACHL